MRYCHQGYLHEFTVNPILAAMSIVIRRCLVFIVAAILASLVILSCNSKGNQILLMPREGSIDLEMALIKESGVMITMLKDAGYKVTVATESGKPLEAKSITLKPDLKLSDVRVADYLGIIMPCMNAGIRPAPPEALRIVQQAASLGLPIAAQRGSVLILNSAGLRGERSESSTDLEWRYGGTGVFQNGMILTSGICPYYSWETGKPDGTVELTEKFIELLERRDK